LGGKNDQTVTESIEKESPPYFNHTVLQMEKFGKYNPMDNDT